MFSMSSLRAPSPASAIATSPEARSSRKARAETAIATSTARPRRFTANCSIRPPRSVQPKTRRSFPAHLPEARDLVGIGGEGELRGGDVVGRKRVERRRVGALGNEGEGLGISLLAHRRIDRRIAALEQRL